MRGLDRSLGKRLGCPVDAPRGLVAARPPRALIMLMDVMCGTPAGRSAPPVGEFFLRTA
ncbi:hypothetical protein ACFWWC_24995 [Streptomyces sp. NPDC058642]|uniref:hypothetical protein n=1 Tax=Streptomyces sp. NPDC058642 TaxID=3346572 RepID=UPI00365304A1